MKTKLEARDVKTSRNSQNDQNSSTREDTNLFQIGEESAMSN